MNAPRRVTLLARGTTILVQHLIDERLDRRQLRFGPLRITMPRRQRAGQRLADNPAMHAELRGDAGYRSTTELMLPAELLEQIHFGFPVHKRPPDPSEAP